MSIADIGPDAKRLLEIVKIQTEIANSSLDLDAVIDLVVQRASEITGADGAVIELTEGDDMFYRAASGIALKQLGLRIRRNGSLSGLCVEQGQALSCEDSETDSRVDRDACRAVGLRSMIVVPLHYKNMIVGVLKVLASRPKAFDEQDIQTIDLMSGVVAAAMGHATEFESQKEETAELFHRATHDVLTGLGNRALFYDHLRRSIAAAKREQHRMGVAMIDMDGLKAMNDVYGHKAGDTALKTLADRLKVSARAADVVARLGGDEFAVILTSLRAQDIVAEIGADIVSRIEGPFEFEGNRFDLKASLGVAVFPDHAGDAESLLESADSIMYETKRSRKKLAVSQAK